MYCTTKSLPLDLIYNRLTTVNEWDTVNGLFATNAIVKKDKCKVKQKYLNTKIAVTEHTHVVFIEL